MSASFCSGCGHPLRAGLRVCTQCGLAVPTAYPTPVGADVAAPGATPVATPVASVAEQAAPVAVPAFPPLASVPAPPPTYESIEVTREEGPPDRRNEARRLVLIGVVALILTLIARIAISAATNKPEPEGEIVAQLPVGPEGGSAEFDDGGKIKVPKGAVEKRQTITVRRTVVRERIRAVSPVSGSIVIPAGAQIVYIFSPATIVFLRPVTIVLPAPPPPARGIVFVSSNGQITFIEGRDRGGTVRVRVNSFDFSRGTSVFVS